MEILKTPYKIRCELGVCKNRADYTVALGRCGVQSRLHVCKACASELKQLLGDALDGEKKKNEKGSAKNAR